MNNLTEFSGVLSPIPTPFDPTNGKVYEKGIINLLTFLKDSGVHGVFAMGSYGSFPLLDPEERKEAMRLITKYCKELDLFNIMHIGAAGTDQALRYAAYAHEIEVDSIASVSPFYYSGHAYRWEDILSYHEVLTKNSSLPYCVYNNPRTTSFALTAANLSELAGIGVSGLKDSGNNVPLFQEYINATKDYEFNCMPGSGSTMLECFRMGATAIVAGTSVCFPEEVMKLYDAIVEGKTDQELDKLQLTVSNCRDRQMRAIMRPAAAYIILKEKGIDIGNPRHPWPVIEN